MKSVNFSFKNHFVHRLYAYILLVLILPSVLVYGIILWTNPKANEVFSIFVDANLIDNKSFESFIKENTDSKNKEINVYSSLSSLSIYTVMFQTQGLESDLLILSDNGVNQSYVTNFIELKSDMSYYSSTNKIYDGKHYGIQIYDGQEGYLSEYIKYENDINYYVFINKNSVHTSKIISSGVTEQIFNLLGAIYG